jgi:type II secretory pathway component PulJ
MNPDHSGEREMIEKALDKIKKLLALANDERGNETERETALRQAYSLMAKHNVEMADIQAHGNKPTEPRINFENDSWSWTWARQTAQIVAELFFCKYYTSYKINGTKCRHHFIGLESNAMTAAVMSDWIINSVLKEGRKMYKENTAPGTRAFALGCMHKLHARVKEIIAQTQADATPGTALVLASLYHSEADANDALLPANLRTRKARQSKVDMNAYLKGQAYGDSINLNRQVGQEPGKITR